MKKYLNAALHKLTVLLEFIISFVLAAGIIILLVQLILSMPNVPDLNIYPNYEDLVAVSYTHLDVYKRQPFFLDIACCNSPFSVKYLYYYYPQKKDFYTYF